jgi:predicted signal transduction protein with EAL and GGDEF domain
MSIGVAAMLHNHPAHADQLVALADAGLYESKENGRNRITLCALDAAQQDVKSMRNQAPEAAADIKLDLKPVIQEVDDVDADTSPGAMMDTPPSAVADAPPQANP